MNYPSTLEAKVAARNQVNALALEMLPAILEALKQFEGKKILNQGNTLSAKAKAALPNRPYSKDVQMWYNASHCGLYVHFKISANYPDRRGEYFSCVYQEAYAFLAEIEGHTLKAITTGHTMRTDYTTDEVRRARERLKEAQRLVSEAQSDLMYFGEHDSN